MLNAMIVEAAKDNVIVAIEPIAKGDTVTYNCAGQEKSLTALEDITIYHKLAACDIAKGQPIVKYGEHIGLAAPRYQGRRACSLPQSGRAPGKPGCQRLRKGGFQYEFLRL